MQPSQVFSASSQPGTEKSSAGDGTDFERPAVSSHMNCVAREPHILSPENAIRRTATRIKFLAIGGLCVSLWLSAASLSWGSARPALNESDFDRANALYEKGDYTNAA